MKKAIIFRELRDALNKIKSDKALDQPILLMLDNDNGFAEVCGIQKLSEKWIFNKDSDMGMPYSTYEPDDDKESEREFIKDSHLLPKGAFVLIDQGTYPSM